MVAVTLVVHEHEGLGRGIELAALAEQLKASDIGLEFLAGSSSPPVSARAGPPRPPP
ncbi:hypothetical protein ACFY3V_31475 [Streptosporangium sp. NPDC000095]|uniref:hypothetical protein n=1 Tax=Streptosporangium sp. NPDC000095 TaxID=3366184 RepID=UPI0036AE1BE1